jgi:hypothetical protein
LATTSASTTIVQLLPQEGKGGPCMTYCTVCLQNVFDASELDECDDQYDEIVSDLLNLAKQIGSVAEVYIPRADAGG